MSPPAQLEAQFAVFNPDTPLCFNVPIVDDDLVEQEECFGVSISLGNDTADLHVSIDGDSASALCCIQDDDRE